MNSLFNSCYTNSTCYVNAVAINTIMIIIHHMKNILFIIISILCFSCSNQNFEMINMRINHYQDVAIGLSPQLVYLVQEGEHIGTDNWNYFYNHIEGFSYESGYIYNLSVKKIPIENPPADGSSMQYELQEIISKEKVSNDTSFEVTLIPEGGNRSAYVTGNEDTGFELLDLLVIDCHNLCSELSSALEAGSPLTGVFHHTNSDTIKLTELE